MLRRLLPHAAAASAASGEMYTDLEGSPGGSQRRAEDSGDDSGRGAEWGTAMPMKQVFWHAYVKCGPA